MEWSTEGRRQPDTAKRLYPIARSSAHPLLREERKISQALCIHTCTDPAKLQERSSCKPYDLWREAPGGIRREPGTFRGR